MSISPISFSLNNKINFKGNTSKPANSDNRSLQNNSPEVRIAPEVNMQMRMAGAFNEFEDAGFFVQNDENNFDLNSVYDTDDVNLDSALMAADSIIISLNSDAKMKTMSKDNEINPETFVKFDYKNFIAVIQDGIDEAKAQLEQLKLSYPDILPESDDDSMIDDLSCLDGLCDLDETSEIEDSVSVEQAVLLGLSMLPDIIKTQENTLAVLKTKRVPELKQALERLAIGYNFMFERVIFNGFSGNARGVLDSLCDSFDLNSEPEIIDNLDGTSTHTYTNIMGGQCEIIRNNQNGDYISARKTSQDGKMVFDIQFSPEGLIKNLNYANYVDKSIISISQTKNKVIARQIFNGLTTERTFVKTNDDKLKQTSLQVFMK